MPPQPHPHTHTHVVCTLAFQIHARTWYAHGQSESGPCPSTCADVWQHAVLTLKAGHFRDSKILLRCTNITGTRMTLRPAPIPPRFNSIVDGFRVAPIKMGSDNPDNLYQNAAIDGRRSYRIWGNRGTVHYLGFGTQAGAYGQPGGLRTFAYMEASELTFSKDGSIEIFIGPDKSKAESTNGGKQINFIPTDPSVPEGAGMVCHCAKPCALHPVLRATRCRVPCGCRAFEGRGAGCRVAADR